MKQIIYLILAIVMNYQGFSQVFTTDELFHLARKGGVECLKTITIPIIIPEELYFFSDKNAAIDFVCLEIDECLKKNKTLSQYSLSFSDIKFWEKNDKLGNTLFDFYNTVISNLKSQSSPDFGLFYRNEFSIDFMTTLMKQNPKGLQDSLFNDLQFLHNEAKKIHPDSYSFFGDIWQFFANGLYSYRDYEACMRAYAKIAWTLKELGHGSIVYRMVSELDSSYVELIIKNEMTASRNNPYKNIEPGLIRRLTRKYASINQAMELDTVYRGAVLMNYKNYEGLHISKPIIVHANEALFWCYNQRGSYLMKVIYIDEGTLRTELVEEGGVI